MYAVLLRVIPSYTNCSFKIAQSILKLMVNTDDKDLWSNKAKPKLVYSIFTIGITWHNEWHCLDFISRTLDT
jgi:hypothetical protein